MFLFFGFSASFKPVRISSGDIPLSLPLSEESPDRGALFGGQHQHFQTNADDSVVQGFQVLNDPSNKIIFLNLANLAARGLDVESSVITIGAPHAPMLLQKIEGLTAPAAATPTQSQQLPFQQQQQTFHQSLPAVLNQHESPQPFQSQQLSFHPQQQSFQQSSPPVQQQESPQPFLTSFQQPQAFNRNSRLPLESESFDTDANVGQRPSAPIFFSKFGGIIPREEVAQRPTQESSSFQDFTGSIPPTPVFPEVQAQEIRVNPRFSRPDFPAHQQFTSQLQPSASDFPNSGGSPSGSVSGGGSDPFAELAALKTKRRF